VDTRSARARIPGEIMVGWLPLLGLTLMAVNDHFLRGRWPCWLTGKLSDFAVVLFFPFLLLATAEWLAWLAARLRSRKKGPHAPRSGPMGLTLAVAVTGIGLAAINLSPACRTGFLRLLAGVDLIGVFGSFRYTMDPTDCLALAALPLAWTWGHRQLNRSDGR